jgi:hypothetical protein
LLYIIGIVLGLAICFVATVVNYAPYGCFGPNCVATPPPEDVVAQYVFYGGVAIVVTSLLASAMSSKYPKGVRRVGYLVLAAGLVVLVADTIYFAYPVVFIPYVTVSGNVVAPTNMTLVQVSFVAESNGRLYNSTIQQGSFSISVPNWSVYDATVTLGSGSALHSCQSQIVSVMSYSSDMTLDGLGC